MGIFMKQAPLPESNKPAEKKWIDRGMLMTILALAWPTMLEQFMQTAVQYIDTAMVGSLGTRAMAAVGSTGTVNWLIGSTISAVGVGFLAYIAKAFGAGEETAAKRAVSQAVLITLILGIFFTAVTVSLSGMVPVWMQVDVNIREMASQYFLILYLPMLPRTASIIFGTVLRSAGDTKSPMKIGVLVNLINVVLNFLLIYPAREISLFSLRLQVWGAGLGVIGAAAASAIAFTAGGICITYVLWKHPVVSPRGQGFSPDMQILRPCLKVAFPNMLQRFGTSLGYVAFAAMINSLGETSTAAHTIANTVESAFYIPGYGMQTAAATLAGNAYGARDGRRMKDLASVFIPLEMILMICSGACLFFTAPGLMRLFSASDEVIRLGTSVLRMVAVSEPFYGFSIIIEGFMMGVGRTKTPFVYNITGMWLVRIVGTFICTQLLGLGLIFAWACMIAHNLLLFVLFFICYVRGVWNPLSTSVQTG
ncbi:MATE family efflux transporter [Parablautia intestinalis]|nr:MATE family efflux transporter [Parablautia intestinalis]